MAASDHLGQQFTPLTQRPDAPGSYPTKGWRQTPDRIKAAQSILGTGNYDAVADSRRKGIFPSMN